MEIKRILYVEDTMEKYMAIYSYLKRLGYSDVEHAGNAEKAVELAEAAKLEGKPFNLFLFDMHFDFFGQDDQKAGRKLMDYFREKGYQTPVIICSSDNWRIPGSVGTVFYIPDRDWEEELKDLISTVKEM